MTERRTELMRKAWRYNSHPALAGRGDRATLLQYAPDAEVEETVMAWEAKITEWERRMDAAGAPYDYDLDAARSRIKSIEEELGRLAFRSTDTNFFEKQRELLAELDECRAFIASRQPQPLPTILTQLASQPGIDQGLRDILNTQVEA